MNQLNSELPPPPFPASAPPSSSENSEASARNLPSLFPPQKIPLIPSSNPVNPVKNSLAITYDFGGARAATSPDYPYPIRLIRLIRLFFQKRLVPFETGNLGRVPLTKFEVALDFPRQIRKISAFKAGHLRQTTIYSTTKS